MSEHESQPGQPDEVRFGPQEAAPFSSPYAPPYAGSYGAGSYGAGTYGAGSYPAGPYGPSTYTGQAPPAAYPTPSGPRSSRRRVLAAAAGVSVVGATVLAVVLAGGTSQTVNGSAVADGPATVPGSNGGSSNGGSSNGPFGNYPFGGSGGGNGGSGGTGNGGTGNGGAGGGTGAATTAQETGVVDIDTVLKYQGAAAAGTGIVLDSTGDVLTNNHVVNGATSIKVTVVSTGKTYTAKVVGTAPTKDIAVIHLQNASGLQSASLGNSDGVSVGDSVTGVGNAGGAGGTPSAAAGTVTAVGKTITASDQDGSGAETLHGVFVTNAPIQPGDSGGPLYDSGDKVIGMDTAASTNGTTQGFAIPIKSALGVAAQIERGVETSAIHIGYPGFLGVQIAQTNTTGVPGALVAEVISGLPAEQAGMTSGDVITKLGNVRISSPTSLKKAVSAYQPGDRVAVGYVDSVGHAHQVTITLATGPAD